MDPRVQNLAKVLVTYCLRPKKGDTVMVRGNSVAEPLFQSLYEELLKAGTFPSLQMAPTGIVPAFYEYASNTHLSTVPDYLLALAEHADGTINIGSEINTRLFTKFPRAQVLGGNVHLGTGHWYTIRNGYGKIRDVTSCIEINSLG